MLRLPTFTQTLLLAASLSVVTAAPFEVMRRIGIPANAAPPHVQFDKREPFLGGPGPGVWHGMPHGPQMASRELDAADLTAREPFHLPSWLHFGHRHQEDTQPQSVSRRSLSEENIQAREAFHGDRGFGGPPAMRINHGLMARAVDLGEGDLEARGPVRLMKWNPALMIGREVEGGDIAAREPHVHGHGGRASFGRGPQMSPQRREDTLLEARGYDTLDAREHPFFPLQRKTA